MTDIANPKLDPRKQRRLNAQLANMDRTNQSTPPALTAATGPGSDRTTGPDEPEPSPLSTPPHTCCS